MITLYCFGQGFGLPDPSPFVMKAEMLLKLSALEYRMDTGGFRKAPKGKLPYIVDDGVTVADSSFIRAHLERKYAIDFDKGYSAEQKGVAWAIEKLLEDHLYWHVVQDRWMNDENFRKGPARFFDAAPALLRPVIILIVRRKLRATLYGQGLGRYTPDERAQLATRAVNSISDVLGEKPFLLGDTPCGADATLFAFTASGLCPLFASATRDALSARQNLIAYRDRMMARYYPDFAN
jgi:glutathione S-transferase